MTTKIGELSSRLFATEGTLSQKVVRGGFWVGVSFGAEKVLGLVRSIILARLLVPEDFGLMGVTAVVLGGLSVFTNTGIEPAIIQRKDCNERVLNTAWVISVIRGIFLCILLFIAAPYVALFFNDSRLTLIVRVISITLLASGFRNIGLILLQKELDFRKRTYFSLIVSTCTTTTAIILAFILKNVWALVVAEVVGSFVSLFVSYLIHPFRPRFQFNRIASRELLAFGRYIFASGVLVYLITQGDDAFVGRFLGMTALGFYQYAYYLSNLPATNITHVISQIIFPAYCKIQEEQEALWTGFLRVIGLTAFLAFPLSGLLLVLAVPIVRFLYGSQWLPIVPALQVLCVFGAIRSIAATTGPLFTALGKPKFIFYVNLAKLGLIAVLVFPLTRQYGIVGTSLSVTIPMIVEQFALWKILSRALPSVRIRGIVGELWPPILGVVLMGCTLALVDLFLIGESSFTMSMFIVQVLLGTGIYLAVVSSCRYLQGVPIFPLHPRRSASP